MVDAGVFNAKARAAVMLAAEDRCIGCGRSDPLNIQHRRARGMGGTDNVSIGHPANGLVLCGSGTTGCHGWTESHPRLAILLGWRLRPEQPALGTPFWQRVYCWRAWGESDDDPTCPLLFYVDPEDNLDDRTNREQAVTEYLADVRRRQEYAQPTLPTSAKEVYA